MRLSSVVVLAGWIAVHASTARWLGRSLLASEGTLHLALAAIGLLALTRSLDLRAALRRLGAPPRADGLALALAALPPVAAVVLQRVFPLDLLSASAAVVSAYGLAGLYLPAERWREARGVALLAAAVLPTTGHLDVYLGFPLRQATAQVVALALGPAEVTAGTVLAVDGGFAHVDLPCSGVKSLWSGAVVLIGAALAWRRPVDGWWAAAGALTATLLVAANTTRVGAVVALDHVLEQPLLAEIIHVPLGVLGFCLAVGTGLACLHLAPARAVGAPAPERPSRAALPVLGLAMAATLALGALPAPERPVAPAPTLPAGFAELAIEPAEQALAASSGAALAKGRFERPGLSGTAVLVASASWLAHHVPEHCLEASGWTLFEDRPAHIAGDPVRWARAEREGQRATALWWFERAGQRTDDHTVRIRAGLLDDETWVLVSVLVQGAPDPGDPALVQLVDDLRAHAAHTLEGA